jgi:hypothetical protein
MAGEDNPGSGLAVAALAWVRLVQGDPSVVASLRWRRGSFRPQPPDPSSMRDRSPLSFLPIDAVACLSAIVRNLVQQLFLGMGSRWGNGEWITSN